MAEKTVEQQVKEIVAEKTGHPVSVIIPQTFLAEDLSMDSLDCIEIVMEIEDVYSIEIHDSESDSLKTFGDLVKLVSSKA